MKTYFIFLCLIVSGGLANATIQNKSDPDKPPLIFVDQYSDNWEQDSGGDINSGATKNYMTTIDNDGKIWHSGSGTSFYHFDEPGSGEGWWDTTFFWSDIGSTNGYTTTGGIGDVSVDGSGPLLGCHYIFTDPESAPTEAWEVPGYGTLSHFYANINYTWDDGGEKYERNSKTFLKIKTGGKVGVNRGNLFSFAANATAYGQPSIIWNDDANEFWGDTPMTAIDPTQIRVLGKNVGNDGNLFTVLPDNATLDLNASAPGRHYGLNVGAQKYKLNIVANGNPLSDDHVRNGAYFCVGQKINFEGVFSPSVPNLDDTSPIWNYTADYVNNHWTDANGCEEYNIAAIPAMSNPTTAWFYNQQTQDATANLGLYCHFSNGQSVYLVRQGMFNVFTPTIAINDITEPRYFTLTSEGVGFYKLQLGENDNTGAMVYRVKYNSQQPFSGTGRITQLCQLNYSGIHYPSCSFSDYQCDGSESYEEDTITPGSAHIFLTLQDGPNNIDTLPNHLQGSFEDYIRFRPDAGNVDDNIFVTLGIVTWNMNATATSSTTISPNQTPDPTGPNSSNGFPFWINTH